MREKYNTFDYTKITKETIKLAIQLKKQIELENVRIVSLRNPNPNLVPVDKLDFLEWISVKYLELQAEIGIPLLKQAYRQQYHIEEIVKLCKYCKKPFQFTRNSAEYCSNRCRQRWKRRHKNIDPDKERKGTVDTLRAISSSKEKPEFSISGTLPSIKKLSVSKEVKK